MNIALRNLGTVNKNLVILGPLTVWFSYETPVSYRLDGQPQVTRVNDWSKTTGKLLNECEPDKSKRIPGEQFESQLNALLSKIDSSAMEHDHGTCGDDGDFSINSFKP